MKISATIITLNEERNIERCILSLKPVADEIIVLDAFSTDRTEAICRELNVRFEQRPWEGYAASKNYLNSLVAHEYILSLDADEALDQELTARILELKKEGGAGIAYSLNRLTNYCGHWIRHSGWYPDVKTRLFPKESYWDGAFVHEELILPPNTTVQLLPGHLQHFSYYSFEDHRARADKYSALTAQKLHQQGKRASLLKPYLSAIGRFFSMYIIKMGFLDGRMGFKIAWISAASNVFKYRELRRLNHGKDN